MELRDIMTTDLVTIGPDESAGAAWSRMERERIRHLLVVEDGRLVGVLSNQDLGGRHGEAVRQGKTVRELMTPDVVTATPDTSLDEAFEIMREQPIGSLPVMEEGKLVGIVTATDVLDALARGGARVTRWHRGRKPDSVKRAPFAERIPRAQKVETTRATPLEVPVYIPIRRAGAGRRRAGHDPSQAGPQAGEVRGPHRARERAPRGRERPPRRRRQAVPDQGHDGGDADGRGREAARGPLDRNLRRPRQRAARRAPGHREAPDAVSARVARRHQEVAT